MWGFHQFGNKNDAADTANTADYAAAASNEGRFTRDKPI
jgi:hypothetical protein